MASPQDRARRHTIAVRVSLPADERAREATLAAYAFSQGGKLLDVKEVAEQREISLQVQSGAESTSVRVLVGPRVDEGARTLSELMRRGAIERHVRVDLDATRLAVDVAVSLESILCWLRSLCTVNGTVIKRTSLGGQSIDLPVCHATVEIYEVDPLIIVLPKLPKFELDKLREVIKNPIPIPDPPPDPLPGPFPGPFPPEPGPGPDPFAAGRRAIAALAEPAMATHTHAEAAFAIARDEAGSALRFAARAANDLQFTQALIDHAVLVRPLLCALFPRWFTMQLVATATTDDCGHFRALFFNGCHNPDKPDLYFKVKQRFFGFFDITIYAPTPVLCYTRWNYACGTHVTLVTHHPLAQTCTPCAPVDAGDNWVLFVAIGATSLNRIFGDSPALQSTTTAANRGLRGDGAPFGGVLRPQLLFDNSLREHLGVKYYRLFWRRAGDPDWVPMLDYVNRHYTYEVAGQPVSQLYKLGPLSPPEAPDANLFEIPPALPPQGVWGPVIVPTDHENGVFDTRLPAPGITYDDNGAEEGPDFSGKFEIKLELFDAGRRPREHRRARHQVLRAGRRRPDRNDYHRRRRHAGAGQRQRDDRHRPRRQQRDVRGDRRPDHRRIGRRPVLRGARVLARADRHAAVARQAQERVRDVHVHHQARRPGGLRDAGDPGGPRRQPQHDPERPGPDGHQPAVGLHGGRLRRRGVRLARVRHRASDRRVDAAVPARQRRLRGLHAEEGMTR